MSDTQMTCEEAIRLLVDYLDGELEPERRDGLEEHMSICRSCYSRHEFEKGLKDRISDLRHEAVRPEFQARISALVSRFAAADQDGTED